MNKLFIKLYKIRRQTLCNMTIDIYPSLWYNIITVKDKDSPKNRKGFYYET